MAKKSKRKYLIGMDLGGTKLLTSLLNRDFKIIAESKSKVEPSKGEKVFLNTVLESIQDVLEEAGLKAGALAAAGMGSPGIIHPKKGIVVTSPNIPFLRNYPLKAKLGKYLGVPVALENDVNMGLLGEHFFGAARGYSDVVGLFMGTGIGGALILNGRLHRGVTGAAGEAGHMILQKDGALCGCGQRGCLEAYAGRIAIAGEAAVLAARQKARVLFADAGTEVSKIKSGVLAKAIRGGDHAVESLIRKKAELVGIAMANIANLLSPELIVLGGGLVEAMGDIIVKEAEKSMLRHGMPDIVKRVKVVPAQLKDHAIVRGAAKLAADLVWK